MRCEAMRLVCAVRAKYALVFRPPLCLLVRLLVVLFRSLRPASSWRRVSAKGGYWDGQSSRLVGPWTYASRYVDPCVGRYAAVGTRCKIESAEQDEMRPALVSGLLKDPTRASGAGLGWGLEVGRRPGCQRAKDRAQGTKAATVQQNRSRPCTWS